MLGEKKEENGRERKTGVKKPKETVKEWELNRKSGRKGETIKQRWKNRVR